MKSKARTICINLTRVPFHLSDLDCGIGGHASCTSTCCVNNSTNCNTVACFTFLRRWVFMLNDLSSMNMSWYPSIDSFKPVCCTIAHLFPSLIIWCLPDQATKWPWFTPQQQKKKYYPLLYVANWYKNINKNFFILKN